MHNQLKGTDSMDDQAAAPAPASELRPALLMRLLGALCRVYLSGDRQLTGRGAVLVMRRSHAEIFKALYAQVLTQRRGLIGPIGSSGSNWQREATAISAGRDALITLSGGGTADPRLAEALQLARAAECAIFPLGVSASPVLRPGRRHAQVRPLPGARVVVVFEAPFEVPAQPEHIPEAWGSAVLHLLERAEGRAAEIEATWRRQGSKPSP